VLIAIKGAGVVEDVRRALLEGRCSVPTVGSVVAGREADLPFVVTDGDGREVEPVSAYLRDLARGDASRLTCRSYAFDLLRWHRLLWVLKTPWEKATEAEVAVLVGWLRQAPNPQRLDTYRFRRHIYYAATGLSLSNLRSYSAGDR
jgi:hypothetical protein